MKKLRLFIGFKLLKLAHWLVGNENTPKLIGWSFTFEKSKGVVFNQDRRGCRLAYLDDAEYEKAHTEAIDPPYRIDWKKLAGG